MCKNKNPLIKTSSVFGVHHTLQIKVWKRSIPKLAHDTSPYKRQKRIKIELKIDMSKKIVFQTLCYMESHSLLISSIFYCSVAVNWMSIKFKLNFFGIQIWSGKLYQMCFCNYDKWFVWWNNCRFRCDPLLICRFLGFSWRGWWEMSDRKLLSIEK
jgi:hypothetical protein